MIMSSIFSIAQAIIYILCVLLAGISAQCTDPLIYQLNNIQDLIANCTTQIQELTETYKKNIANLTDKLEKQVGKTLTFLKVCLNRYSWGAEKLECFHIVY